MGGGVAHAAAPEMEGKLRRLAIIAAILMLAGCAGYLAGCVTPTLTTSPVYPSPSAELTELPPVNWPTPTDQHMPRHEPTEIVFLPDTYHCACECDCGTPTPTPEPPPLLDVEIYDCAGQITNTTWLTLTFGDVGWNTGNLAELRCSIGPAVLVAHVEDAEGQPVENATVVLWYSTAPYLPPELQLCNLDKGVFGPTNSNGDIGFGLGGGSYYYPPAGGPHVMWVAGGTSCLAGLGMLGGTEHQHLDSTWVAGAGLVEEVGNDWGYSAGTVMYDMTIGGRRMWVIRVP
jgi:hypothetical protein